MSLPRPGTVASSLLVALGLALPAAPGQEADKPPARKASAPAAVERQTYAVRGGAVKNLANALSLHFQAEPGFRAVPEVGSNVLLLSGPKAVLEEAQAVLREIDRPARTVHVEVYCLELTGKAGGEPGGNAKPLNGAELLGAAREVRAKLRDLQQKGAISSLKTVELTGLTGQSARTQVSENRPFVTGVSVAGAGGRGGGGIGGNPGGGPGGGMTTRSIAYRNVGTSVQVTPEVGADGQITLDLHVEDSSMRATGSAGVGGADDKGPATPAAEFTVFSLESRLQVRSGQVILAEGTKAESKAGQAQMIVLVSATAE